MSEAKYKVVELSSLHVEEGAKELFDSPGMQPYAEYLMAIMQGADPTPALEYLRRVPLEGRYVWRVASALKWAFADCETDNVDADKQTLSPEELARVVDLLKLRPMQMAIFLKALVGAEEMQRMRVEGIKVARQAG